LTQQDDNDGHDVEKNYHQVHRAEGVVGEKIEVATFTSFASADECIADENKGECNLRLLEAMQTTISS
jgi:hypothetical protein